MPLAAGTSLGPYQIDAPLGAGGMGEVYKARDTRLDRTVAIKVLPAHVAADPDLKQRFEREAKTISSLNHPHICTLHDIGSQDGIDFLVMEYLEGETLAERLAGGPLPLSEAVQQTLVILSTLEAVHRRGLIHRDLKPANLFLTPHGLKLLDFGLARPINPALSATTAKMTQAGTVRDDGTVKVLDHRQYPISWSPDGTVLTFVEIHQETNGDIWVLTLSDRSASRFVGTPADERGPMFSPDGHWIAYTSDESGQDDVYVQPYPGPGGKQMVSTRGGDEPTWSADGQEQVVTPFLRSLGERGLDVSQGLLVIVDGGKGLRAAVRKAFRHRALVQRCQWHKRENVVSYVATREQPVWRQRLQRAYNRPEYDEALAALRSLQRELEDRNQSAAGRLAEGLDETLTLQRLGVYGVLGRSLKTTNGLESINALIEERCAKVDHWQNSSQRHRWLATALLDIEPRLRKVMGYRHLPRLRDALKRALKIDTTTSTKEAA